MPPSYLPAILLVRLLWLFSGVLTANAVPSEFWVQVVAILEVPTIVKVLIAPFLGSAVVTGVEYLAELKRGVHVDTPVAYWPIKVGVGWITGLFVGIGADGVILFRPESLAFWSGVTAHGTIALYLATQAKKINDVTNNDNA